MRDILTDLEEILAVGQADPMGSAQRSMRPNLSKRFYKTAAVMPLEDGFGVGLDERPVKTPGKTLLVLPTQAAAQLVADEFETQKEKLDPALMPCYRLVNTAIDGVAGYMRAVIEDALRFCGTDLLCYRADGPQELVDRQRKHWDGPLEWIEQITDAQFNLVESVIHVAQPRETIAAFGGQLKTLDNPFTLAAYHSMMTLTGSAILALAVCKDHLTAAQAWQAAHVDEDHVIDQWGEDEEAKLRRTFRWSEMDAADRLRKALIVR